MKILIVGGGTGGHIYPGIAIADRFMLDDPKNQVLFVGTEQGLETKIVPENGYEIKYVPASGINRKKILENHKFIKDYVNGKKEAKSIIKEFEPDVVIGTGGYVTGAVVSVAAKMKIPTFIQEQNVFPGLANRSLEKHAKKVFLAFKGAAKEFKNPDKLVVSGNPIGKKFEELSKEKCREKIKVNQNSFLILIVGGSLGAGKLNQCGKEIAEEYANSKEIEIVMVTGEKYFNDVNAELSERKYKNVRAIPYANNMEQYMEGADLVLARSGALTVSELTFLGKPSVFVPSPNVTRNHQFYNAEEMASKGSAIIIEEKDITSVREEIKDIISNKELYEEMVQRGELLKGINGAEIIVEIIKSFVNESE